MPIFCARDNENNRWKIIAQKNKNKKRKMKKGKRITRGTETIAKGWEVKYFVERLSQVFSS